MVATEFEIKFAQSRIDYFDNVLKKGANDKVKTLLKAIKAAKGADFSASGIAKAIKAAKEVEQKGKDAAVKAADADLKTATTADTAAKAAATKAATDLTTATTADTAAKAAATKAATDLAANPTDATLIAADTDAKAAATKAATDLTTATTADTDAKAAATKAATDLTTAKTAGTAAKAAADLKTATDAKTAADGMKVGEDDLTVAAKALLGDKVVTDIKATTKDAAGDTAAEKLYVDKAPEFLKSYGFINAIAKNIPNAGKDVLKGTGTFDGPATTITDDNIKILNDYAKIVTTVCGIGPFVTTDFPEKDVHSNHVENCLKEANKVAFTILSIAKCGKDQLDKDKNISADCYEGLANEAANLYITTDFDKMHTDLSGEYPYNDVVPGYDAIAV
ncbi:MAG: hypothetical protein AB8B46_02325 [Candidatus Midichloriaceae bacterium]